MIVCVLSICFDVICVDDSICVVTANVCTYKRNLWVFWLYGFIERFQFITQNQFLVWLEIVSICIYWMSLRTCEALQFRKWSENIALLEQNHITFSNINHWRANVRFIYFIPHAGIDKHTQTKHTLSSADEIQRTNNSKNQQPNNLDKIFNQSIFFFIFCSFFPLLIPNKKTMVTISQNCGT